MRLFSLCFPIRPRIYASTLTIWGILLVGASRADWPEHRRNLQHLRICNSTVECLALGTFVAFR